MKLVVRYLCAWPIFCLVLGLCPAQSAESASDDQELLLLVGYTRNFLHRDTIANYTESIGSPQIGLMSQLDNWLVSLSVNYKMLHHIEDNTRLNLLSIQEQTLYRLRIYHPLYLFSGGKLLYLYPSETLGIPLRKDGDLSPELGVAATLQIGLEIARHSYLNFYMDLWRGTDTKKFQGREFGITIALPLF